MIIIELGLQEITNKHECPNEINGLLKFKADTECFNILNNTKWKIAHNYFGQQEYVFQTLMEELGKVEENLFEKWNLQDGIFVNDFDSGLGEIIMDTLTNKFANAKSMSEVNNETVLNSSKLEITNFFNQELEQYAREQGIEEEHIQKVKQDVPKIVEKYFDRVVDKMFNNKTRDELEDLCNKWEKAYERFSYKDMNEISQEILGKMQKDGELYRDKELELKLEEVVTKNQFIQNKILRGEEGILTKIENDVIMKYVDKEKYNDKPKIQNEKNDIVEFSKEIQRRLKEIN